MTLYAGEKVYEEDADKYPELIGDGNTVVANGEPRLLSRLPPEPGHTPREYSKVFAAEVQTIPESDWEPKLKEQLAAKRRTSDNRVSRSLSAPPRSVAIAEAMS